MKDLSLYIHIPFCIKKCGYCDFISFTYDEEKIEKYLNYLEKEIKFYKKELKDYSIKTIFIGGGTPSLLSGNQMIKLMNVLRDTFDLSKVVEISMESNPGTLLKENVELYKKAGINRISVGVQTLNNKSLKSLDRIHDVDEVYKAIEMIKKVGINDFNMDLMFGLPGQSLSDLEESIEGFIKLNPTHISAYSLKYEEGTKFYSKLEEGMLKETSDELDRDMYHLIIEKLKKAGYFQYEISNFSKINYKCKHNLVYWKNKEYIGMGIGAHSSFDNKRFNNAETLDEYYKLLDKKKPIVFVEEIEKDVSLFETIMLSLRLDEGLDIKLLNNRYDINFKLKYKSQIKKLLDLQLVLEDSNVLILTQKGKDLSNQVFLEFLE